MSHEHPPAVNTDTSEHAYANPWKAVSPLALVSVASTLNSSVVNVSLPVISEQLQAGIGIVEWVIMSYLLALTSLLMIAGRVGDLLGRRRTYMTGLVVFTLTTALCGFATSITTLILYRVLQGIAGAFMMAIGPALIGEIFPPAERGKALGILGTTVSVGLAVGPAVGGIITDLFGWRYIFFVNIPVCLIALYLARIHLRKEDQRQKPSFDLGGSFTMAVGLIALTLFLSRGSDLGWADPQILIMAGIALVFLTLFIRIEKRYPEPLLDLGLFKNTVFSSATASGFFAFASLFTQTFLLPFYLIQLRGFPAAHAGLYLMAVPTVMGIVAPLSGALSDKIGTRGLCAVGLLMQGVSYVFLAAIGEATSQGYIVGALMLQGLGIGMFNPPNNADLLGSVPRNRMGNASGMMGLTRTLGMIGGVAMSTAIFIGVRGLLLRQAGLTEDAGLEVTGFAFLAGLKWAFRVAALLAWLGALVVLRRRRRDETVQQ